MKYLSLLLSLILATSLMAANTTLTMTAEQLANVHDWETGGFYSSFTMGNVVTVTAHQPDSGKLNGYYSPDSPRDWRLYQARNNGEFEISIKDGFQIQSICLMYSTSKNGVLSIVPGSNTALADQIASNQIWQVNAQSITLYAGNTGSGTTGQVRISAFQIVYSMNDSTSLVESFSQVEQKTACTTGAIWKGDYADWDAFNTRRATKDTLNGGTQASWSKKGGYLRSAITEGGIKHLRFEWRQFVTQQVELVCAIAVGDWKDTARMQSIATQALSQNYLYDEDVLCKENTTLSFENISPGTIADQERFLLGDFYITPYLVFKKENQSIELDNTVSYIDLYPLLLDNTEGEGPITYTIVSDETGAATISGSVVEWSGAQQSGTIEIEAGWNDNKVTTHMTLSVQVPEEPGIPWVETFSNCTRTDMQSTTFVMGDDRIYEWNLTNFTRTAADMVADQQGIQIRYKGAIASNGIQQGGIKDISFSWRSAHPSQPVHFIVKVDGVEHSYKACATGETNIYRRSSSIRHNTAFSVSVGAEEKNTQTPLIVGEISITPYLLFTMPNRVDTLHVEDSTYYDFMPYLLDNTNGEGEITYSVISDETGGAIIWNGYLDVDPTAQSGNVVIQAAWEEVTTTMTIYVHTPFTAIESIEDNSKSNIQNSKLVQNGQLIILHNGVRYNAIGVRL